LEENKRKAGKLKKAMAPLKKSVSAPPMQVLALFPNEGLFITGTNIQCPCTNKVLSSDHADQELYKWHVNGKKHQKYL
jgi:hypothetical protein